MAELSNDTTRLLYTWILSHLDINGNFYADPIMINNLVFTRLGHSVGVISKALDELADKKLIIKYKINGEVYLNYPDFHEKQNKLNPAKETTPEIPNITPESILSQSGLTPLQDKIREDKISKDIVKNDGLEKTFNIFWKVYPRKVNKKEAKAKWFRIKLPDLSIILKALEIQKQTESWQKDNGKYIPHPTTWLNQERWNDEVYQPELKHPQTLSKKDIDKLNE